jgi:hypothetical protein
MPETKVATRQQTNIGGSTPPAGIDKELQYNNNGLFGGVSNVDVEAGNLALIPISDPTAVSGKLVIYSKDIAGRTMPKWMPPSGVDNPFQSGLFFNQVSLIQAGSSNVISTIGCTVLNVGTISHPNLAVTNLKAQTRRFSNTSAVTAGALASTRVGSLECWRGNAASLGGFFVVGRFSLTTLQAGMRAFFGLSSTAITAPTNVDPTITTTDAKIGMAINANTGNWKIIHNSAGTAPTIIDLGTNFTVNTNDMIEMILFAKPNHSVVTYRIKNLTTNLEAVGTLSTNLPANTLFLGRTIWATNNATAASVAWDCSRFGLETDF